MSSHEFAEWQAFDRLEPVGGPHLDVLIQRLAYVIYNSMRMVSPRKTEPMTEEEFAIRWHESESEEAEEQAAEALDAKARGIFGLF